MGRPPAILWAFMCLATRSWSSWVEDGASTLEHAVRNAAFEGGAAWGTSTVVGATVFYAPAAPELESVVAVAWSAFSTAVSTGSSKCRPLLAVGLVADDGSERSSWPALAAAPCLLRATVSTATVCLNCLGSMGVSMGVFWNSEC